MAVAYYLQTCMAGLLSLQGLLLLTANPMKSSCFAVLNWALHTVGRDTSYAALCKLPKSHNRIRREVD